MENKEVSVDAIDKDPGIYEVGFHIVPIVAEGDVGARVTAIRDLIEGVKGHIIADEYPKHMDLAYPMVKIASNKRALYHTAYFGWTKFEALPSAAKAIEEQLKKDDTILRFVLVKTVRENTMVPRKVLQQKRGDEREETKPEDKPVLTEAEIDKTIDDLVIN